MAQSKKRTRKVFKPLAIAALMAGAMLQPFMLPAFAAAGDQISNTATATYEDEDGTPFETESNTVVVTITEVAGITVTPAGVEDVNAGSFEASDELNFNFTVTNVGNDTTDVQLPSIADIQANAENFTVVEVFVYDSTGALIGSYVDADGAQLLVADLAGAPLQAGDFVTVEVNGTILPGGLNPGDDIRVTLGDTAPNDNSLDTQNQDFTAGTGDISTFDLADGADPNEAAGPVSQEKEASATQFVDFATQQKPLALATVKKTDSNVDPGATGAANDDVITYDLTLTVEDTSPSGEFIPTDLDTTPIDLDGTDTEVVLVSDAIPEFTEFTGTAAAPAGWQVIYSYSDVATTSPVIATGGTAAAWTVTAPTVATASDVTRIGFIPDTVVTPLPANATEITGFTFDVETTGLPAAGGSIYNLAQVFGTTYDDPANPNDPVDQIIYDESGDDNPNNFNDDGTPPAETDGSTPDGSDFDPTTDTGETDPANHGTDDGSNTGTGEDGEDNVVPLTGEELTGTDNILNGPDGSADAVGATDDDDDYTNAGVNPADSATDTVEFTNTVANPATNTSQIDNVTLQPISPTQAAAADEDPATDPLKYGDASLIPVGTTATIDYDPTPGAPTSGDEQQAVYEWDGSDWVFDSSTGTPVANGPVNVGTLEPGEEVDYNVTLDFGAALNEGDIIEVPIIAFPDTDSDGYVGETVNNITIDRVYVGFMELSKEARILDVDGTTVLSDWSENPAVAESGQFIEYRITYENISPTASGSGNAGLSAENFKVIEDGDIFDLTATAGDNNWDSDLTPPMTVHASGVQVSAGTVNFYDEFTDDGVANDNLIGTADPATGSDVEAYVNEVGTVAPGGTGTMIFRRQVQ